MEAIPKAPSRRVLSLLNQTLGSVVGAQQWGDAREG